MQLDPVSARRSLGSGLRKLRIGAGISAERAADELDCSISKISRIENGISAIRPLEVKALLGLYRMDSIKERTRLLVLAGDGRTSAWYDTYGDLLRPGSPLYRYVGLESSATSVLTFSGGLIPGVLQTEEYVRTLYLELQPDCSSDEIDRLVELRIARNRVFLREPKPPDFAAVIDEAALLRPVGGPSAMLHQLEALRNAVQKDEHDIRVLPLQAGFHSILCGPFTVLTFESGENPDLVFIEGPDGVTFQDKPETVQRFTQLYHSAAEIAVRGLELVHRLDRLIHEIGADAAVTVSLSATG